MEHNFTPTSKDIPKPADKMFGFSNSVGAALLGGLFAAIYVMYKNYTAAGMKDAADRVLRIGLPITVLIHVILFYVLFFTEIEIPWSLGFLSAILVGFTQNKIIKEHEENNGQFFGLGRTLAAVLLSATASLAALYVLFLLFYSQIPDSQANDTKKIAMYAGDSVGWQMYDIDQFTQESKAIQFYKTENGVQWNTYLNTKYLFKISLPEDMRIFGLPSNQNEEGLISVTQNDEQVSIGGLEDETPRIKVGVMNTNTDNTLEIARSQYIEYVIPAQIPQTKQAGTQLTTDDFVIEEIVFRGKPALEIRSPILYGLLTLNSQGNVVGIQVIEYDGGQTTEEDRQIREIIETFSVF